MSVRCWTLRYDECKEKLVPFLKKVGFNPKKDIYFMPCSGLTGANLKEPADMCSWYMYVLLLLNHSPWLLCYCSFMSTNGLLCYFRGLPFIPHLDSLPLFNRSTDGPVRLPIVDKYKVRIGFLTRCLIPTFHLSVVNLPPKRLDVANRKHLERSALCLFNMFAHMVLLCIMCDSVERPNIFHVSNGMPWHVVLLPTAL